MCNPKVGPNPTVIREGPPISVRPPRQGIPTFSFKIHPLGILIQIEALMMQEKAAISEQMEKNVEKLRIARSDVIPTEVMNQVFELLSVTDEKFVR